jgi:hypothetical protein
VLQPLDRTSAEGMIRAIRVERCRLLPQLVGQGIPVQALIPALVERAEQRAAKAARAPMWAIVTGGVCESSAGAGLPSPSHIRLVPPRLAQRWSRWITTYAPTYVH